MKLSINIFQGVILSLMAAHAWAAPNRRIEGTLREKGTRNPISGASIYVIPSVPDGAPAPDASTRLRAITDEQGRYTVSGEIPDDFEWVINVAGYERFEAIDRWRGSDEAPFKRQLFLQKDNYQVYETTVFGQGDRRDDTKKSLKAAEFLNLPGSGGDPIKAVQNLPGVNRVQSFNSQVAIQGSAPRDTKYTIDGHEVPIIFHFGGLTSVVQPEALDRVDYLSAGYGPEFGRTSGGLVGAWTRAPRTDRVHGMGFMDTFNSGGQLEGPAGQNGSFMVGLRQSYIGQTLKRAVKNNPNFNLTVVPEFRDALAMYEGELTPIDHFRVVGLASEDKLGFLFKTPIESDPAFRGTFDNTTSFFRIIPQLTHKHGENTVSKWSLGLGRDYVKVNAGENYFHLRTWQATTRFELEHRISETWVSQWGLDNRFTSAQVDLRLNDFYSEGGVPNPFTVGAKRQINVNSDYSVYGAYWRNEFKPVESSWTLMPSVRADYFNKTEEFVPAPRLAARYQIDESLYLRGSSGIYYQPPQEQESDSTSGNPDIESPKAIHGALGVEKDFRGGTSRGLLLSGGGFYKHFDDLIVASSAYVNRNGTLTPENFNNNGRGHAYGLESMLKMELDPWSGWLAYTLSKSERWRAGGVHYPFEYDQTHNLTLIAAREMGRGWRLSSRLRYTTGSPTTPITGASYDADNDVYIPTRGALYSQRLDPFMQLDVRVDKKWIYDTWIFSIYLDVQNATNAKNSEDIRYAYDYRSKSKVTGLPILPTFGLKGEF